ncbi:MAG: GIY-YIG nuclease family protein [Erysipelotrichaceae bacterium]|nr:GIY-YIG nuclease family protein [Erysipelotrichaceae bacterium]
MPKTENFKKNWMRSLVRIGASMIEPKKIEIFLMDGEAEGRWDVRVVDRSGQFYKIPRSFFKDSSDLEFINTPGIYFLFGNGDDSSTVYIGEPENTYNRICQPHKVKKEEILWNQAIIFVASDDGFDKSKVKYLEHQFYHIFKEANRYKVLNSTIPAKAKIQRSNKDVLDGMIEYIKLVMSILGYSITKKEEPKKSAKVETSPTFEVEENGSLYCLRLKKQDGVAYDIESDMGFIVKKGSNMNPEVGTSCEPSVKKRREELIENGIVKNFIFQEDVEFKSKIQAESMITVHHVNAQKAWKKLESLYECICSVYGWNLSL